MRAGSYSVSSGMDAGVSKLQRLRQLANGRNVFVLTIGELEKFLEQLRAKTLLKKPLSDP